MQLLTCKNLHWLAGFADPVAPVSTKGTRGKKRKVSDVHQLLLPHSSLALHTSALAGVHPGAAVFENSIGQRAHLSK